MMRVGLGIDVHAFAAPEDGRRLVLGGVEIPPTGGSSGIPTPTFWPTP